MTEAARRPEVLFVDDERRILKSMKALFRSGFQVHLADNGAEALDIVRNNEIDVIVSDQRMPRMTGIEVLRSVKDRSPATMRILLTGYSDLSAIIQSINEGEVYRFINKPWANEELRATVADAAEIAQRSRALPDNTEETVVGSANSAGVLVIDDDPAVRDEIESSIGVSFDLRFAATMEETVEVLEGQEIGVIISETSVRSGDMTDLLLLVKRYNRNIVNLVMSEHSDPSMVIRLINQGQVHRFLPKPVDRDACWTCVNAAMKRYQAIRQSLERDDTTLADRYRPESAPAEEETAVPAGISQRLRSLRASLGA
ncbi:MAG TPA: response regulator [Gammaproteobacteria bacterium]|nr:response regulator [Gammaproteobacteria bacterium]